jgi:hypothetical protein
MKAITTSTPAIIIQMDPPIGNPDMIDVVDDDDELVCPNSKASISYERVVSTIRYS